MFHLPASNVYSQKRVDDIGLVLLLMEEILYTTSKNPVNNGIFTISTGFHAGFRTNHPQYHIGLGCYLRHGLQQIFHQPDPPKRNESYSWRKLLPSPVGTCSSWQPLGKTLLRLLELLVDYISNPTINSKELRE